MKRLDIKSLAVGLIAGVVATSVGIGTVSALETLSKIESATYSESKVYFYDKEVPLENSLVAIKPEGSENMQLYMPVRELLEYMQFNVEWNDENKSVNLTMNGNTNGNMNKTVPKDISKSDADQKALELIQNTGNWSYIEQYLPHMSNEAIERAVDIYNSKHTNTTEHKDAKNFIKD